MLMWTGYLIREKILIWCQVEKWVPDFLYHWKHISFKDLSSQRKKNGCPSPNTVVSCKVFFQLSTDIKLLTRHKTIEMWKAKCWWTDASQFHCKIIISIKSFYNSEKKTPANLDVQPSHRMFEPIRKPFHLYLLCSEFAS